MSSDPRHPDETDSSAEDQHGGDGRIEEEEPELRHVKIAAGSASLKLPPLPAGKLPGPPKGSMPSRPSVISVPSSPSPLVVTNEWSAEVATWKVTLADIERLPDFPLERTNREIHGSDVSVVATRISAALQKLSILADYEKDEAKCQTSNFVSFCVRLYSGGEFGQPVVVEVQRRRGCCVDFMRSCRAVLNAAEGMELPAPAVAAAAGGGGEAGGGEAGARTRKTGMLPFVAKPIGQMKCLQGVSLPSPSAGPEGRAQQLIESCIELLTSDKFDSNVMGMEKLACLTDPVSSSPLMARELAKAVITGSSLDNVRDEVYAAVARAIDTEHLQLRDINELRRRAIRVFDNSLKLYPVTDSVWDQQSWLRDALLRMLVEETRNADSCPHSAYLATSCLCSLASCCSDARSHILTYGGSVEAVQKANEIGQERHELLANESQRCLNLLLGN